MCSVRGKRSGQTLPYHCTNCPCNGSLQNLVTRPANEAPHSAKAGVVVPGSDLCPAALVGLAGLEVPAVGQAFVELETAVPVTAVPVTAVPAAAESKGATVSTSW